MAVDDDIDETDNGDVVDCDGAVELVAGTGDDAAGCETEVGEVLPRNFGVTEYLTACHMASPPRTCSDSSFRQSFRNAVVRTWMFSSSSTPRIGQAMQHQKDRLTG